MKMSLNISTEEADSEEAAQISTYVELQKIIGGAGLHVTLKPCFSVSTECWWLLR